MTLDHRNRLLPSPVQGMLLHSNGTDQWSMRKSRGRWVDRSLSSASHLGPFDAADFRPAMLLLKSRGAAMPDAASYLNTRRGVTVLRTAKRLHN